MIKFLFLIAKLIGVLLLLNVCLYIWVGDANKSRFYNYYKIIDEIDRTHYKYVVTGDSHADACWGHKDNPEVLDFSFPGDNQIDIQRKISFLKKNNISYDTHLYEIDAQVLTSYRETTNNNDLSIQFDNKIKWIRTRTMMPLFFNPRIWSDIMNQFKPNIEATEDHIIGIDTSGMVERAEVQFLKTKFSEKMYHTMKNNLIVTINQGHQVKMVHYPFYNNYIKLIQDSGAYIQSKQATNRLIEEINSELFDFSSLFCKADNFYNQDHLNSHGSKLFLRHFTNCLKGNRCKFDCID